MSKDVIGQGVSRMDTWEKSGAPERCESRGPEAAASGWQAARSPRGLGGAGGRRWEGPSSGEALQAVLELGLTPNEVEQRRNET